ncbi:MAG: methyltransferase type 11, partial [Candidatus Sumerlaeia bacterium]|nr:methyltransferase type 11 [Candidatus Sumerlaeia bacterium]
MSLPDSIRMALDKSAEGIPLATLQQAAEHLGSGYRDGRSTMSLKLDDLAALAYGIVRLPATHAALLDVLMELEDLVPDFSPATHLDLGAGPGTATLASLEVFSGITSSLLVEREPAMRRLGQRLVIPALPEDVAITWDDSDITSIKEYPAADLVTLSFALVEVDGSQREDLLRRAFDSCLDTLVLVEPGTVPGFEAILKARDILTAAGGNLLAPCPHGEQCPMEGTESWCHFSRRLSRTR